ncbi:glycosyltransferase [Cellulomonas hominis]|uniref:glycosyltransferase n=1 Tax=Cellulomonas hominis TaxID=156981 RepID=UPI001B9259C1|nr:glycosyltransferase [Cellulomonas hominis]VTR78133.1 Putative glycosyltransferase EpsH [Cellulomonas hominis]
MADVSVIIAAKDAAATLPAQLAALAAQDPPFAWEVLVADNGSADRTAEVVQDAARTFPALRLVDAAAVPGAGAARNAAAEVARGDVLLFCDADDVVAPGWAAALHRALGDAELVAGRLEWARLNGRAAQESRALPQVDGLQHTEPLPWLGCASSSNLGVRRDLFHRVGGFDTRARFLQDTDLCWRAQLAGAALVFEPAAVVHMRLRRGLRGAWRQGRSSGMGQRWLAARYGPLAAALREAEPSGIVGSDGAAGPDRSAEAGGAPGSVGTDRLAGARRAWPGRIARRAVLVGGDLVRVRSAGDVARLAWATGFGIGYARGGLPDPAPLHPAEVGAACG